MKEQERVPGHTVNDLALGHARADTDSTLNRVADLERQLADERARIDCATRGGWLSDDLECAGEDGPACWTHLLREARGKLDVVQKWLEPSGVAQHHEVTKVRNELRAILKEGE